MNITNVLFNISQVMGLTIIHSLWQGMLIYFVLRMLLAFKLSAPKKYMLSLASLIIFTGWFVYTLATEIQLYNWAVIKAHAPAAALPLMLYIPAGVKHINTETLRYYYDIEQYLPYLTAIYITGILYHTGKLVIAYHKISLIKNALIPDTALQASANTISAMFNIGHTIKAGYSKIVDIPCITGFIKPIILLPFALPAMLSTEEIEAILLHEIAHIRRNDYLVNVVQQIISVMVFFNPFAWLINRIIDRERENCCDNIVVDTTGKPLIYAHALLKIEQNAQNEWQLALAATGKKRHLLTRIEYIMKTRKPAGSLRQVIATFIIFAFATTSLAWLNPSVANGKISIKNIKPAISKIINTLSVPKAGIQPANGNTKQASAVTDTTKRKKVTDITNDRSNHYQVFGEQNATVAELEAELNKHQKLASSYKENADYKAIKAKMDQIQQTKGYYDNDTLANIMSNIAKARYTIENVLSPTTGRDSALSKRRDHLGAALGMYYNSRSFNKMNEALQKKYSIDPVKGDFNSTNYKKYQAELKSKLPVDIKNQTAELADISTKFSKTFASSEWKNTFDDMKFWIDSMKNYYKTPHSVQRYDNRQALHDEYMKYLKEKSSFEINDTVNRERQLTREYADKLNDYISHHSTELVQQTTEWRNQLRTALGDDYNVIVWREAEKENQEKK